MNAPDDLAVDPLAAGGLATDTLGSDTSTVAQNAWDQLPMIGSPATPDVPDNLTQQTPTSEDAGITTTVTGTGLGSKIVQAAEHYLGRPYFWGGEGWNGVDCSGLVQLAYKAAGIDVPRISFEQANAGTRVSLAKLRPGDLVAWDNSPRNPGADHIAIYIGNGQIIEAAHPGTNVRIRKLGSGEGAWGVRMGW